MKRLLIVLFAASLVACKSEDKKSTAALTQSDIDKVAADSANYTTMQWLDSTSQNLGKIKEGQVIEVSYRFKNTGSKSLVIENVHAGCGCTVPEKPERPFAPGEEGVIKAKFDSRGRKGVQDKFVTVRANTSPQKDYTLKFLVEVTEQK